MENERREVVTRRRSSLLTPFEESTALSAMRAWLFRPFWAEQVINIFSLIADFLIAAAALALLLAFVSFATAFDQHESVKSINVCFGLRGGNWNAIANYEFIDGFYQYSAYCRHRFSYLNSLPKSDHKNRPEEDSKRRPALKPIEDTEIDVRASLSLDVALACFEDESWLLTGRRKISDLALHSLFVTVGTTEFDELIRAVCSSQSFAILRSKGVTELVLQIGSGSYEPIAPDIEPYPTVTTFRYRESLSSCFQQADWVISHAGAASCLEALELGKPLLIVVNETLLDNHQVELARQLSLDGYASWSFASELPQALSAFDPSTLKQWHLGKPDVFASWLDKYFGFN
ncbi:hypothetical protein D918_07605 [Trichuris suis]|nr:hypothetical protein D918_07605 [Trichuris suis]